jgi:hypothetical protein
VDGAHERVGVEHRREVDERAGDRRDRDAAVARDLAGVQPPHAVDHDAGHPPVARRRHLRPWGGAAREAVDVRRRLPAQPAVVTAREHRSHVGGLDARRTVPDAVHAAVHGEQLAAEPSLDRVGAEAGREQLRPRHDPVLATRHPLQPRR